MKIAILCLLTILFTAISALHFFWLFGGRWGLEAALPRRDGDSRLFEPGKIATLIVSLGLILLNLACFNYMTLLGEQLPYTRNILLIFSAIFALRFIGEFNYVGFFSRKRPTSFHYWDIRLHSPLSLLLGSLLFALASI